MTIKEIEEIKKKDKQRQQRNVICHKRDGIVTIGKKCSEKGMKRYKGNHNFTDLRYGGKDSISPSTLIFAATKG